MYGRREIGQYAFGVVYNGFLGLGMTIHWVSFQESGKALYRKRVSKRYSKVDRHAE
jgi:hypothetical protein